MINKFINILVDLCRKSVIETVVLTGGTTAVPLYGTLAKTEFGREFFKGRRFFLSDERCVGENDIASNGFNILESVGRDLLTTENFERIVGWSVCGRSEATRYSRVIPPRVDLIILSAGVDGHIASLFGPANLVAASDRVIYVPRGRGYDHDRISVSYQVIEMAREVLVLARGRDKGKVLAEAVLNRNLGYKSPIAITLGRHWVLDYEAADEFCKKVPRRLWPHRVYCD